MIRKVELYQFQKEILNDIEGRQRCALFCDMGLGKSFMGSEHVDSIAKSDEDIYVICQLSKVRDWVNHWRDHYRRPVMDFTRKDPKNPKIKTKGMVIVVNYDLVWRRPIFREMPAHIILDESSLIQNDSTKRTKFIMKMHPISVTLLSGTPCSGKYENLWTQVRMLGWNISKSAFWDSYVIWHLEDLGPGTPKFRKVDGYKNVEHLKRKLREYGSVFMKAEEAVDLPNVVENTIHVSKTADYKRFARDRIITIDNEELVGDNSLTMLLRLRQLAGMYSLEKMETLEDILQSTDDKFIVFYNFTDEEHIIRDACMLVGRKAFTVSGSKKEEQEFHDSKDGVLIVQLQAGSYGLNLQDANRAVYYSPPLSSDQFEQSKARIHRIGQNRTCFYIYLVMEGSVEEHIYSTLARRADFTLQLFDKIQME